MTSGESPFVKPGFSVTRVWRDDDVVELQCEVCDGVSLFSNKAYCSHEHLSTTVSKLAVFKTRFYGGLFDMRFGSFGCEYASGALLARFHFPKPGNLYVSFQQESDFCEFGGKTVASRAQMFLKSKAGLLDRFIEELRAVSDGSADPARLEAV